MHLKEVRAERRWHGQHRQGPGLDGIVLEIALPVRLGVGDTLDEATKPTQASKMADS